MAEVIISPDVLVTPEHSRIYRAWLWMRELMKKAAKGFASGATKIRVTITQVATSATGMAIAAGAQLGLATRAGWNGAATVVTKGMGLIARAAIKVAQAGSWVIDKIGKGLSWFVGLFNKRAGENIAAGNERFTIFRKVKLGVVLSKVEQQVFVARAAITHPMVSNVGRTYAGVVGVCAVTNVITGGAVAAKVAATAGPTIAMVLGPVGLLATGAIALVGGLLAWLFKRDEVLDQAAVLYYESRVKIEAEVEVKAPPAARTEMLEVDLTEEDGTSKFKGGTETIDIVSATPESQADLLAANMSAQLKANGMKAKPLPGEVTPEVIKEALRLEGKAVLQANGEYAKNKMDTMRTLLRSGDHPMPVMEPISA